MLNGEYILLIFNFTISKSICDYSGGRWKMELKNLMRIFMVIHLIMELQQFVTPIAEFNGYIWQWINAPCGNGLRLNSQIGFWNRWWGGPRSIPSEWRTRNNDSWDEGPLKPRINYRLLKMKLRDIIETFRVLSIFCFKNAKGRKIISIIRENVDSH